MIGAKGEVFSAGVDPWPDLHPIAVELLQEKGIDPSGHYPKHVRTMMEKRFDWVITIGDRALAETPQLHGRPKRIHWPIDDPAKSDGTPDQRTVFQMTLEGIEDRLPELHTFITGQNPKH